MCYCNKLHTDWNFFVRTLDSKLIERSIIIYYTNFKNESGSTKRISNTFSL